MKEIKITNFAGGFAEDKDAARRIRVEILIPELSKNSGGIILDFEDVEGATQSFIHALISDLIRKFGNDVLDRITFKNCNPTVRKIINIVTNYMQESV